MGFTGIVEETGTITNKVTQPDSLCVTATIECKVVLEDAYIGCSIAVEGVCLTVTRFDAKSFDVDIAPETLDKTHFSEMAVGQDVNLERAAKSGDRISGHNVQGHVEETGSISHLEEDGGSLRVHVVTNSASFLHKIIQKGYIAIDGASLTVCDVLPEKQTFTIMLIPHSRSILTLGRKKVGDSVNLESDIAGRYSLAPIEVLEKRIEALEYKYDLLKSQTGGSSSRWYSVDDMFDADNVIRFGMGCAFGCAVVSTVLLLRPRHWNIPSLSILP